jgi:protoheme IX farnesyltransferase
MKRTRGRPLPAGRMDRQSALHFGVGLAVFSVLLMGLAINLAAAAILTASILFYVLIYTVWLKRRTPQNIVIGGAAGAFPPLIGWAAATGEVALLPVLLFAFVFLWTPPHFWALAMFVKSDYANAGVPMLPVVAGERATRHQIGLYSIPMAAVAIGPWPLGLTGAIYGAVSIAASAWFLFLAARVALRTTGAEDRMRPEKRLFGYSVAYLFIMFGALVVDRWLA